MSHSRSRDATLSPGAAHAVVTGDIIGSGRLSGAEFQKVHAALPRGGEEVRAHFPSQLPLPLEISRGDSWQMLITRPADAFRIALYLRAFLRAETGADTRFAIGVGPIEALPEQGFAAGRGQAFQISGELLDEKSSVSMRFGLARPDSVTEERAVRTVLLVLDVVVRRWTDAQARAVCGALLGWKQEKIAQNWRPEPITQQAAGQHLASAGWEGVRAAVAFYEETMKAWVGRAARAETK